MALIVKNLPELCLKLKWAAEAAQEVKCQQDA